MGNLCQTVLTVCLGIASFFVTILYQSLIWKP